ncbi:hypothetical protein AAFF_G00399390 [Aldrovandia affinis]|uniref:Uncharacterized protein n=1 Tax=Aldrovandia affinis TaxID=143900 RepID=A0AAD7WKQ5_9TELE|nr:hypothetical protein AAFF_G00399390 [Aldrovandia affinis]
MGFWQLSAGFYRYGPSGGSAAVVPLLVSARPLGATRGDGGRPAMMTNMSDAERSNDREGGDETTCPWGEISPPLRSVQARMCSAGPDRMTKEAGPGLIATTAPLPSILLCSGFGNHPQQPA